MRRSRQTTPQQRYLWKAVAYGSGALAALGVRRVAASLWRTSHHEADPPTHPAARNVSWRDALTWAMSAAVGTAVARVVAERGAAAAWNAATGTEPPIE